MALLGTGPLVSFLAAGLEHHEWVVEQWKRLKPPMLTWEAVLTEAAFLLKREGVDTDPLFVRLERDGGPPLSWARMWLMGAGENSLGAVSHRESVTAPPIHEFGPFSGPEASRAPKPSLRGLAPRLRGTPRSVTRRLLLQQRHQTQQVFLAHIDERIQRPQPTLSHDPTAWMAAPPWTADRR